MGAETLVTSVAAEVSRLAARYVEERMFPDPQIEECEEDEKTTSDPG